MLHIEPENVQVGAVAASKEEATRQVADLLVRSGAIEPGYAGSMLAREKVANTYLGHGIAIPHGLPKDRDLIRRTAIAVLQVPAGVPWNRDHPGDKARLVVGIAAKSDEHLDVLGRLTHLLDDDALVDRLASTEQQGASPDREGASPYQKGGPPERAGATPEREGAAPEQQGGLPDREGASPYQEGRPPERAGAAPEREGAAPEQEGASPDREGASPYQEGGLPERAGAAPEPEGAAPDPSRAWGA